MRRLALLILIVIAGLAHRSDGQQTTSLAQQLKLSAIMPRGAMVYVQAGDLSALMKTWVASPVRSKFYASDSFAAFQKSRVYLKLQDRKKDLETAIGVGLDETRGELQRFPYTTSGNSSWFLSARSRARERLPRPFSNKLRSFRNAPPMEPHTM
jgi:hypothetical protein